MWIEAVENLTLEESIVSIIGKLQSILFRIFSFKDKISLFWLISYLSILNFYQIIWSDEWLSVHHDQILPQYKESEKTQLHKFEEGFT